MLSLQVSRSSRHVTQEAIQLHGGIGMTAEYVMGGLAQRLTLLDHLFGGADLHLRELVDGLAGYAAIDPLD